jgi:hypothetical protein
VLVTTTGGAVDITEIADDLSGTDTDTALMPRT